VHGRWYPGDHADPAAAPSRRAAERATLEKAGTKPLRLRLSAAARKRIRQLLKPGRQARATITVRAVNRGSGQATTKRIVIFLTVTVATPGRSGRKGVAAGSLATFMSRIELMLRRSATDRTEIASALTAATSCSSSAGAAAARVAGVASDRQGLLDELASLGKPTAQAVQVSSLLQRALSHSVRADGDYRDWLAGLGAGGCPRARTGAYFAAQREDVLATAAKRSFVSAFNPLARQLGLRT
jgi:hypothetical protein